MEFKIVIPPIPESKKPIDLLFIKKLPIKIDSLIYLISKFYMLKT